MQRLVIARMQREQYREARTGAESPANGNDPESLKSKVAEATAALSAEN